MTELPDLITLSTNLSFRFSVSAFRPRQQGTSELHKGTNCSSRKTLFVITGDIFGSTSPPCFMSGGENTVVSKWEEFTSQQWTVFRLGVGLASLGRSDREDGAVQHSGADRRRSSRHRVQGQTHRGEPAALKHQLCRRWFGSELQSLVS